MDKKIFFGEIKDLFMNLLMKTDENLLQLKL